MAPRRRVQVLKSKVLDSNINAFRELKILPPEASRARDRKRPNGI